METDAMNQRLKTSIYNKNNNLPTNIDKIHFLFQV
jgi:hypothetical protein